jgi:hypothetical protein
MGCYRCLAYLYESLDLDIYMKVHDGITVLNMHINYNMYCVKLVSHYIT